MVSIGEAVRHACYQPCYVGLRSNLRTAAASAVGLLNELVSAENPNTKNAASDALQRIEKAIGAAALQPLRTARSAVRDFPVCLLAFRPPLPLL